MTDILDTIETQKRAEISAAKLSVSLFEMERKAATGTAPRGFLNALRRNRLSGDSGVIAEIKKASPSKGVIREDFNPAELARAYEAGGAACLSVLTDEKFFQGHNRFLQQAHEACTLPVLRKDFLFDTYQVTESRALGADCILIIMAAVDDACARDLYNAATHWKMDALIEVHDERELERALKLGAQLIGINNRNLRDFSVDLAVSTRLVGMVPPDRLVVSESGMTRAADLSFLKTHGISTFLIGETLMREKDVTAALQTLLAVTPVSSASSYSK